MRKRERERESVCVCVCEREKGKGVEYWSHRLSFEGKKMEGYLKPARQRRRTNGLTFFPIPSFSVNMATIHLT